MTKSVALKDFKKIVGILKLLKPVLDEAVDSELPSDEHLTKVCEELDTAVNKAREILEKRPQRLSKIYTVLQSEPIVLKVQDSAIDICHFLIKLLNSCSYSARSASVQHCLQELQCAEHDLTFELIGHALKDLQENTIPSLEEVMKIMDNLGLASNQELLLESIALEKEKAKLELQENMKEADYVNQIIMLVNHIRHCVAKLEQFGFMNGIPIPTHFHCPLSLQLMLDPVILASGQTYERSFIQKWLDSGLRVCPKTCQTLGHTNLIPNYTVKALIANWCEDNNIKLKGSIQPDHVTNPFLSSVDVHDFRHGNGFHSSIHMHSTSRSSLEFHNQTEQQKTGVSSRCGQEEVCLVNHQQVLSDNLCVQQENGLLERISCHSHSESISSVVSSIELGNKFDEKVSICKDMTNPSCSHSLKDVSSSPLVSENELVGSKDGHDHIEKSQSSNSSPKLDDLTTSSHVLKLVSDLRSQDPEVQAAAALELRFLAKNNMENRILIAKCGAIPLLISLLHSKIKKVQENAVTALLNLSINDNNKVVIAEAGALQPLIHVLEYGSTEAKENSAAALFSLSVLEEYKIKIGRSGAVKALVNLLVSGSLRGKKDAATALFNLSILHDNKARIVQAGAVKYLVELMEPNTCMVDKSVALLANLSTIPEGRLAIVQEGGIPLLVEIVETGSQRGKENAATTLLQLCLNSQKFCSLVLQEGAVPPLIALSQFGTPRAKEKAQQILSHFRSQREGIVRKVKS